MIFGGHYDAVFLDRDSEHWQAECNDDWGENPDGSAPQAPPKVYRSMCSCKACGGPDISPDWKLHDLLASGSMPSLTTVPFLLNDVWILMAQEHSNWTKTTFRHDLHQGADSPSQAEQRSATHGMPTMWAPLDPMMHDRPLVDTIGINSNGHGHGHGDFEKYGEMDPTATAGFYKLWPSSRSGAASWSSAACHSPHDVDTSSQPPWAIPGYSTCSNFVFGGVGFAHQQYLNDAKARCSGGWSFNGAAGAVGPLNDMWQLTLPHGMDFVWKTPLRLNSNCTISHIPEIRLLARLLKLTFKM